MPARSTALAATDTTALNPLSRVLHGLIAVLVISAASRFVFPLPFTPVPLTLQPLAILLTGLLLGPVDGTLAVLTYLAEGAAGLPVFSPTGPGGLAQLLGPTGGYLMADPVVALIAGWGVRQLGQKLPAYPAALLACTAAIAVLFLAGAGWLSTLHPMGVHALWLTAIGPFLPGEAIKMLVAAGIYRVAALSSRS